MKVRAAKVYIGGDEFLLTEEVIQDYGDMQVVKPALYKRVNDEFVEALFEKRRERMRKEWRDVY